jgi:hypothetical protein
MTKLLNWREIAAQHDVHALAGWMPEDIQTMRPEWTVARCREWLTDNQKWIVEAMVRDGWGAIEALLTEKVEENDATRILR